MEGKGDEWEWNICCLAVKPSPGFFDRKIQGSSVLMRKKDSDGRVCFQIFPDQLLALFNAQV